MRLTEMRDLVADHGARRRLEKRALAAGLLSTGLQLPSIVDRASRRHDNVLRTLDEAASKKLDKTANSGMPWYSAMLGGLSGAKPGSPSLPGASSLGGHIGGNLLGSVIRPIAEAPGKGIAQRLEGIFGPAKPGLIEHAGEKALDSFGSSLGSAGVDLLKDLAAKAMSAMGSVGDQSARDAILKQLRREDMVLSTADDKVLMEAYHTMVRFAPVLSTDKNAVRSFLRQAVMSGAGPDYASIKLLADSERAVTGRKE